MDTKTYIIILAVVCVVAFIYVWIKGERNTKKGVNSEEKRMIREIVNKLIPGGEEYTAAYATWEWSRLGGGGRTVRETTQYWYYAVAFKEDMIHVIPLSFAGQQINYGTPMSISSDSLKMVNGKKGQCWASFYDKEGKEIVSIMVLPSNTKDDRYHPVNIQQEEEAVAFEKFVMALMEKVNTASGVTVTGKPGQPLKK